MEYIPSVGPKTLHRQGFWSVPHWKHRGKMGINGTAIFCLFAYLAGLILVVGLLSVCSRMSGAVGFCSWSGRDVSVRYGNGWCQCSMDGSSDLEWLHRDRQFIGILGGVVIPEYTDPWRMTVKLAKNKNLSRLSWYTWTICWAKLCWSNSNLSCKY